MADILANYVKFLRGTPTAYAALTTKDKDTLYFIAEKDQKVGKIYLGDVLIAGSVNEAGDSIIDSLAELIDVNLQGLVNGQVLGYNGSKWVPMTLPEAIAYSAMEGASADKAGAEGLVPAPAAGDQNKFLRGDGTWATIDVQAVHETQIFETELQTIDGEKEDHDAALIRIVNGAELVTGDIAIIKDPIVEGNFQYTAYVYNGTAWEAMDGNYSASNVYLKDQIVLAGNYGKDSRGDAITSIGNMRIGDTIPAGTSLQSLFMDMLSQRLQPSATPTQPAASITLYMDGTSKKQAATTVEVGTEINPYYVASLSAGSYTYGPSTGIAATSYAVTSTGRKTVHGATDATVEDSATTASGSFDKFIVDDDTSYKVSVSIPHNAGAIAQDNLGGESNPKVQIAAGTKTKTSGTISGYRAWFCGYKNGSTALADAKAITGEQVRALGNSANGSWVSSMDVSQMKQMFFAAPAGKGYKPAVTDSKTTAPQTVLGPITVYVPGANNYTAPGDETANGGMAYDVWYVSNTAAAAGGATLNIAKA
jgi:hypothetical protein